MFGRAILAGNSKASLMLRSLVIFALVSVTAVCVRGEEWPQFRGPRGDGVSQARNLPTTWGDTQNIAWQAEIPGRGWSSPVVLGDRIWLTTAEPLALPAKDRDKRLADLPYYPRDL